ncbi:cupin domain-containing protein [Starkeya sp. 3C]|uniref:Cupin domain-containing protein n=2 Tax=Ancylobacter moscoviensis TaxID=2597768 RepID=A0ABY3DQB8_9HYPH|nr:cupin domain-containing protein [Ancylobacter moscoviensis]
METPDANVRIGAKLKHARLLMGLSLSELGQRVGVTEGYLSKLENGRSQASLATLHKLVQALDTNMSTLFAAAPEGEGAVTVVRAKERPRLETGHLRAGNQVVLERLVPHRPDQLLQINIHVIPSGGGSPDFISHGGQEFGYVLAGAFTLVVDGHERALGEGDSFYFDSSLPHGYRNDGEAEARVLWVNTPPTF